ncbi:hypothetical protein KIPB_008757 [Kipferlia bialata]|uniref:Uncharacterized protein n=1 Tax=Kipferlia bialata TaxID=797122 RepID=A0A9K3D3B3_9EUKA|nr:hypothetical protein KIPB_008757 [Kipferlia bialata]|eukprot:g8757.t1
MSAPIMSPMVLCARPPVVPQQAPPSSKPCSAASVSTVASYATSTASYTQGHAPSSPYARRNTIRKRPTFSSGGASILATAGSTNMGPLSSRTLPSRLTTSRTVCGKNPAPVLHQPGSSSIDDSLVVYMDNLPPACHFHRPITRPTGQPCPSSHDPSVSVREACQWVRDALSPYGGASHVNMMHVEGQEEGAEVHVYCFATLRSRQGLMRLMADYTRGVHGREREGVEAGHSLGGVRVYMKHVWLEYVRLYQRLLRAQDSIVRGD